MKRLSIILGFAPLLLLLMVVSCRKQIEFTGEESERMPVLVSFAEADSAFAVKLSYSRFFLSDEPFAPIDDAVISIESNGTAPAVDFIQTEKGFYYSNLIVHEGDTMSLRVAVAGEKMVGAGCRVPTRPRVSDVTSISNLYFDTSYWSLSEYWYPVYAYGDVDFSFVLHDPVRTGDCYMLRAYIVDSASGERESAILNVDDNVIYDVEVSDQVTGLGTGTDYSYGQQVFFTDSRINGQSHTIKGTIYLYEIDSTATIQLQVCSVSRDAYLYLVTLKAQQESGSGLGFIDEPVQIHTNVVGGIGILGAICPHREDLFTISFQPRVPYNHENTNNR